MEVDLLTIARVARDLFSGRDAGVVVPLIDCASADYAPREHECHRNVDLWVAAHPSHRAVRGWCSFQVFEVAGVSRFAAHSVIADESGRLFDPTPCRASKRYPFLPHPGGNHEFERLLKRTKIVNLDYRFAEDKATYTTPETDTIPPEVERILGINRADLRDRNTELAVLEKQLDAVSRYGILAEDANLTVEEYLARLARDGDKEAEDLLAAFNNPFTKP